MSVKYVSTQFVQVKHTKLLGTTGEPFEFWRNALYICADRRGNHMVQYTDGTREVLNASQTLRPVRTQEGREVIKNRQCQCHIRETTEALVECPRFNSRDLDADCETCDHKFNCHSHVHSHVHNSVYKP